MSQANSFIPVNDAFLIQQLDAATERIVFLAPGISKAVAQALSAKWHFMKERVSVILDVSPEVCRLGYGDIEGLQLLQTVASEIGCILCHEPGVRIGLLIVDSRTLIYSPTPLLIEAQPKEGNSAFECSPKPNAIFIDTTVASIEAELGINTESSNTRTIGLDAVNHLEVTKVESDLKKNPPLKFDIARYQTVFNAKIEFVELEILGCAVSRKTASIPPDLMGIAKGTDSYGRIRSSFKVIGENDTVDADGKISEKSINEKRLAIEKKYLVSLKGFGKVILRANRQAFEQEIDELRKLVADFSSGLRASLETIITKNTESLKTALFPAVVQSPPERWQRFLGPSPSGQQCADQLERDLEQAFGTANDIVREMKVNLLFKGVTYDTLKNPQFREIADKELPGVLLVTEYDAAQGQGGIQ